MGVSLGVWGGVNAEAVFSWITGPDLRQSCTVTFVSAGGKQGLRGWDLAAVAFKPLFVG